MRKPVLIDLVLDNRVLVSSNTADLTQNSICDVFQDLPDDQWNHYHPIVGMFDPDVQHSIDEANISEIPEVMYTRLTTMADLHEISPELKFEVFLSQFINQ